MTVPVKRPALYAMIGGILAAMLATFAVFKEFNWALPWSAAQAAELRRVEKETAAEVRRVYAETSAEVRRVDTATRAEVEALRDVVVRTDAKLDLLLQKEGLKYRPRRNNHE